jgi:uncharacterized membrane protein YccC
MTLPEQSDRAVKQTREFLVRLASPYVEGGIKGIRREVRAEALRLLRHYPLSWLSQNGDYPESDNAANEDNLLADVRRLDEVITAGHAALTNEERESLTRAVTECERVAREYGVKSDERRARALRGLLERLA